MDRISRFFARLWPTIFGPQQEVTSLPVTRLLMPPRPMYRDPLDGEWEEL